MDSKLKKPRKKRELIYKSFICKKCSKPFQAAKKAIYCSTTCRYDSWLERKIRAEAIKLYSASKGQELVK